MCRKSIKNAGLSWTDCAALLLFSLLFLCRTRLFSWLFMAHSIFFRGIIFIKQTRANNQLRFHPRPDDAVGAASAACWYGIWARLTSTWFSLNVHSILLCSSLLFHFSSLPLIVNTCSFFVHHDSGRLIVWFDLKVSCSSQYLSVL